MSYDAEDHGEGPERQPEETFSLDDVIVVKETEKALLCLADVGNGQEEVWVPKSQITDDSEVYAFGTDGKLVVTEWIAKQKEWL